MSYKEKYLKYKEKYIELKGGMLNEIISKNNYDSLSVVNKQNYEIYQYRLTESYKKIEQLKQQQQQEMDSQVILQKPIITPVEYGKLSQVDKQKYVVNTKETIRVGMQEFQENPTSYIKRELKQQQQQQQQEMDSRVILQKPIITPVEYGKLSQVDKQKYVVNTKETIRVGMQEFQENPTSYIKK